MTGKKLSSDETMTAFFSYLWILVFIPLLAIKNKNDFIKFHVQQGLNLFLIEVVMSIAGVILSGIPVISLGFQFLLWIGWLIIFIAIIIAIINAVQGDKWEIPIVNDLKLVKIK